MQTEVELVLLPDDAQKGGLLERLTTELNSKKWTRFRSAVGFARASVKYAPLFEALKGFVDRGGDVAMTFGADTFAGNAKGSDYEAIRELVDVFDGTSAKLYLYREEGLTFHPKVYLFDNEQNQKALLIVGSSNWSQGGLLENVELSMVVHLAFNTPGHRDIYRRISRMFERSWSKVNKRRSAHVLLVTTENLDKFKDSLQGSDRRISEPIESSGHSPFGLGPKRKKIPKKYLSHRGLLVWEKTLTATDVQRSLRLTSSGIVGASDALYFREKLFGEAQWDSEGPRAVATVKFAVSVFGKPLGYGERIGGDQGGYESLGLRVSHRPPEKGQRSYTNIGWGAVRKTLRANKQVVAGKRVEIRKHRDGSDPPFTIAITEQAEG